MTIAEKLQTIAENEPKVYEAGREKGYREGYTDATSGTAFEIDDTIAYRKVVPSASEKLAQVLKVGGMTYRGEATQTLRSAKVTALVSEGVNLFDISQALNDVLVDNGDGTYTISNYGSGNRFAKKVPLHIPANTSFAFFGTKLSDIMASFVIDFADASSTTYPIDGLNRTQTYAKDVINIQIYLPTQYAGQSATFSDFQIEYGTVATEYKPYVGTLATKPIPEALRNFLADKGYGFGINETYYNYIDFERKVFVQRCKKIVFDGSENWIEKQVGSALVFRLTDVVKGQILGNGLCNKYEYTSNAQINPSKVDKGIYAGQSWVTIRDVGLANVSALKAQLATWYAEGNPLTVIYPLDTAIETDISAYLTGDSLIEVQGGGTITAVNEYELPVPSTIQYIKKVGA